MQLSKSYKQKKCTFPLTHYHAKSSSLLLDESILHIKGYMIENSEDHDEIL